MKYEEVLQTTLKETHKTMPTKILTLDPGETTGFSVFDKGALSVCGHIKTVTQEKIFWEELERLFHSEDFDACICEDYRVYAHKATRHTHSPLMTARVIGGIDYLCQKKGIPLIFQSAAQAKGFVTDQRLKDWGMWQAKGKKHANDAIRHGIYYLIVGRRK